MGLIKGLLNNYTSYDGTQAFVFRSDGVTAPITPNKDHYVVTENVVDPTPNLAVWRLEVTGRIGSEYRCAAEAEATVAALARADGFDFATVFSRFFLDFATALAMADNNPKRGRRCAPYTILTGSAQAAKPRFPALEMKHPEHAKPD